MKDGPNSSIQPEEVETAIDPATLEELVRQTGLSKEELLRRLANELPSAVDRLTPDGIVPDEVAEPSHPSQPNLLDDVLPGTGTTRPRFS